MKIVITPKTPEGEVGLRNYIVDNQELTKLVKGMGFIRNMGKIKNILRKWHINYSQYVGTRKIVEKYSNQDGNLEPIVLTIELFDGQCDKSTGDKYITDLIKVFNKCYNIGESDLNIVRD